MGADIPHTRIEHDLKTTGTVVTTELNNTVTSSLSSSSYRSHIIIIIQVIIQTELNNTVTSSLSSSSLLPPLRGLNKI